MNTPGYIGKKATIQNRLRRIEGQIRGLQGMVDDDRYCIDILDQISATTRALQAVALELLDGHLSHCVANAVAQGESGAEDMVGEASSAIARLVRS
ncbi:MAG: metal-sensitive transcriptional regulator [Acidimicrobiales bacterium]